MISVEANVCDLSLHCEIQKLYLAIKFTTWRDYFMPKLRSATSTQGRNMAGARALWRATGMKEK